MFMLFETRFVLYFLSVLLMQSCHIKSPKQMENNIPDSLINIQEVIQELDGQDHLLVRVSIGGDKFVHRAQEPFVQIIALDGEITKSWYARITDDGTQLHGYFAIDQIKHIRNVVFGYGNTKHKILKLSTPIYEIKLDTSSLPPELIHVTQEYISSKIGM